MTKIKNERQYEAACERIEELLAVVDNSTPATDRNLVELDLLGNLVADYEEEHYPVAKPSLPQTIRSRM
ncbi:MAG: transcriptional regulator, partial [Candidatus Symbiothrix sp.]|nr:transcriptional regulator [Candidatus Symbiothrix sp.]